MKMPKATTLKEALDLGGDDLTEFLRWDRERVEKEQLKADYGYMLFLTLKEFKKETERGPYQYQPDNGEDDDDARLAFIKYMTGEKGYHYAKGEQHANHN